MTNPRIGFPLKVKRLHPDAILPKYQSAGAACFDLHAVLEDETAHFKVDSELQVKIPPGGSFDFRIGLAFEVPEGFVIKVYSRSGHGFKHGIRLANGTGIIDSDYRGEMRVKLHNDSGQYFAVGPGDRIAQCLLEPVPRWNLIEVSDLSSTERGENGCGSTGR